MNSQFYTPKIDDRGKEIVSLIPTHLVINRSNQNGNNQALALKQIARNIPKCQFISLQALKELAAQMRDAAQSLIDIKTEPEECQMEQVGFVSLIGFVVLNILFFSFRLHFPKNLQYLKHRPNNSSEESRPKFQPLSKIVRLQLLNFQRDQRRLVAIWISL